MVTTLCSLYQSIVAKLWTYGSKLDGLQPEETAEITGALTGILTLIEENEPPIQILPEIIQAIVFVRDQVFALQGFEEFTERVWCTLENLLERSAAGGAPLILARLIEKGADCDVHAYA